MKKADINEKYCKRQECRNCKEYDTCDNCGRRVCYYVAVFVGEDEEVWCRPCARRSGASKEDIKDNLGE